MPELPQNEDSDSYSDIELTEDEAQEALRVARELKFFRQQREAYAEKIKTTREPIAINAEKLYEVYKQHFVVDQWNENILKNLCCYFSNDKRFKGSLTKGILLVGPVGIGKTELMRYFCRNQQFPYRVISCREVARRFAEDGPDAFKLFKINHPLAVNEDPFCFKEIGFCFDDLGTEDNAKNFGSTVNMMSSVILDRYDANLPLMSTHITTNLSAEDIRDIYGDRVVDRVRQMFNVIEFDPDAPTRRK